MLPFPIMLFFLRKKSPTSSTAYPVIMFPEIQFSRYLNLTFDSVPTGTEHP